MHLPLTITLLGLSIFAYGQVCAAPPIAEALAVAGDNGPELQRALDEVPSEQAEGMRFLIANMPERDLKSLKADYLLENVRWAYEARAKVPWGATLPDDVFLNDVLPYASINERRDNWRRDFYEKFMPLVKDCQTPGEAAQILNRDMWKIVDVQYHATKRPKPDQSPYESIEAKFASCSGLSVLLIDACRAVSVPARFAGTPLWSDQRGNHSWVEVWDGGEWHYTGACEYNPGGLGKAWFGGKAAKATKDAWQHAIYASTWKKADGHFPLVWDLQNRTVNAVNVTDRYTGAAEKTAKSHATYIEVFAKPGGERVPTDVEVFLDGVSIAKGRTRGPGDDTNNMLSLPLVPGKEYVLKAAAEDFAKSFTTTGEDDEAIRFDLSGE